MKVTVHLYTQATPVTYANVHNTYQKGDMYCVMLDDRSVGKLPLIHIFRIMEH